jgi:predicted nucleic-acid-binding protein
VIGIDTNVLVRYFTQDDALQTRRVEELFESVLQTGERLHVSDVVLSELVWVLRRVYGIRKEEIVQGLQRVVTNEIFVFDVLK